MANILIVDDDPAVQMTIRLLLEGAGHRATICLDATQMASRGNPDVSTGRR
ncbi:response regulator [Bradyrhizobium sp. CCGUVB1N3]|nr:response regulator [Bradyrhizobium sp. CCGUVB1N3]MCP3474796.1 response regulator [Bradyrhizobium sp. CCGUVB1N3]